MTQQTKGIHWWSLISGVLQLIAAVLLFKSPLLSTATISLTIVYMIAIGAILHGIYLLTFRSRVKEFVETGTGWLLFLGILQLVFGILLFFRPFAGVITLPLWIALVILTEATNAISLAVIFRRLNRSGAFWFSLIVGILGVVAGLGILFNPVTAFAMINFLVTWYFAINGIRHIINAFTN